MKYYLQTLIKLLLPTLGGLIVGSLLAGIAITLSFKPSTILEALVEGSELGLISTVFACVPTFLWGAPLYALALSKGKASYFSAALIGATPGLILLLPQRTGFAELCLDFGIAISICTHFFAKHFTTHPLSEAR